MVLEVYVLARTKAKVLMISFKDTSPADRSLRFWAMIGSGLMVRDNQFCTATSSAPLILMGNPDYLRVSMDDILVINWFSMSKQPIGKLGAQIF